MRRILRSAILATAILGGTIGLIAGPPAEAKPGLTAIPKGTYQISVPRHKVKHLKVDFVVRETSGRATVTFNDGQTWSVRPCQVEDAARCYWDAQTRGNHQGTSFVRLFKHTFPVQTSDYLTGLR